MLINLKTCALNTRSEPVTLENITRLPANIEGPCTLVCEFQVQKVDNYFLLSLKVEGDLTIICQRCLHTYRHHYVNSSTLAVCDTDEMAERLLPEYESIVADNNQVELVELISDELYLYSPEMHAEISECDRSVDQYIRS
ncbi:YceD family protein [Legionella sp. CNM-4043-24]|uniref:YceD family protein n=1 Tax=Legionella sp. CNM-4043-24 TaxID=3421646 RepID=UPI00403B1193